MGIFLKGFSQKSTHAFSIASTLQMFWSLKLHIVSSQFQIRDAFAHISVRNCQAGFRKERHHSQRTWVASLAPRLREEGQLPARPEHEEMQGPQMQAAMAVCPVMGHLATGVKAAGLWVCAIFLHEVRRQSNADPQSTKGHEHLGV